MASPQRGRLGMVAALAALLLFVSYGAVPRFAGGATGAKAPTVGSSPIEEVKPTFDVDSVVERARHTMTPIPGRFDELQVIEPGYHARFEPTGFRYAPDGTTDSLGVGLRSIDRGGRPVHLDPGRWEPDSNVAARSVADGMQERVTARDGEIEWDVVLTTAPVGTGDLLIQADLTGDAGDPVPAAAGTAWQLTLADGTAVEIGETVVKDGTGAELYRALPVIADGRISLVAPHDVLERAVYPLTIDPTVSERTIVDDVGTPLFPSVAFDGTDFLVVWDESFDVFGAQVSGDGSAVQPIGPISDTGDNLEDSIPDVAWNGTNYLVVWTQEFSDTDLDVLGRRISAAGFLLGPIIPISRPSANQSSPAVAAAGSTYYVTWTDDRTGNADVFGGRVSSGGAVLNDTGVAVTTTTDDESQPDVAWNGTTLLVAYRRTASSDDVYARRVNTSGNPVGTPVPVSTLGSQQRDPAVASDGSQFLTAWTDTRNSTVASDIYGARLNGSGTNLDPNGIPISTATTSQESPALAFNGTYLAAWDDLRENGSGVFAARVTTAGAVQDPNGFEIVTGTGPVIPAVAAAPGSNRWAIDYHDSTGAGITEIGHRIAAK